MPYGCMAGMARLQFCASKSLHSGSAKYDQVARSAHAVQRRSLAVSYALLRIRTATCRVSSHPPPFWLRQQRFLCCTLLWSYSDLCTASCPIPVTQVVRPDTFRCFAPPAPHGKACVVTLALLCNNVRYGLIGMRVLVLVAFPEQPWVM